MLEKRKKLNKLVVDPDSLHIAVISALSLQLVLLARALALTAWDEKEIFALNSSRICFNASVIGIATRGSSIMLIGAFSHYC